MTSARHYLTDEDCPPILSAIEQLLAIETSDQRWLRLAGPTLERFERESQGAAMPSARAGALRAEPQDASQAKPLIAIAKGKI